MQDAGKKRGRNKYRSPESVRILRAEISIGPENRLCLRQRQPGSHSKLNKKSRWCVVGLLLLICKRKLSPEVYIHIHIYLCMYGKRVQADVGLLLHYCERTYSVRSRNGSVQKRVAGAGSNRKSEWKRMAEGGGEGKEEEEKEESTVSPECIDSTVAQFSLLPLPLFTSSDPPHFLALLVYPPPSLACTIFVTLFTIDI